MKVLRLIQGALATGCTALLMACSSSPEAPEQGQDKLREYLNSAYQPAQRYLVQAGKANWTLGGDQVEVAWLVPKGKAQAPLIVYLPGLGESAEGGGQWRRAWAEAGYAVLSLQAVPNGPAVYLASDAQAGNFRSAAQKAFAEPALAKRVQQVRLALAELRQQAAAGDLVFSALNFRHWLVAGFDLGAQTAAAVLGEHAPDTPPSPFDPAPVAAILLSPYATAHAPAARFAELRGPFLSITGPQDEDPFNWVASVEQRTLLWRNAKQASGCQLLLSEASHATLSGRVVNRFMPRDSGRQPTDSQRDNDRPRPPNRYQANLAVQASQMGSDDSEGGGGGRGPGGRGRGGEGGGPGGGARERREMGHGEADFEPPTDYRQTGSIQAISVAFLDANVSHIAAAKHWLNTSASDWLSGQGSLVCRAISAQPARP